MHITQQILEQIIKLSEKHQVICLGEMHGVKENPEVVLELYDALKNKFSVLVGFEYPQTVINNLESADKVLHEDGRYSSFHKKLLEDLKSDEAKVFGFDLNGEQSEEQKLQPLDWRDKVMAENINTRIASVSPETKIILVTGDMHYQTKSQSVMYPGQDGELKPTNYIPMAAQLNTTSILAIHLRYLSGNFYNFKLRQMPKIDVDKSRSFREQDDVLEIDILESHPTKELEI